MELSLEDTASVQVRIGDSKEVNAKAAYVRDTAKTPESSKSTDDLRALSTWIAQHREIADLNGEAVRVRTKKGR